MNADPTVTIRPAVPFDAEYLAPRLRDVDVAEIRDSNGASPLASLLAGIEISEWCHAAVVGGEVVALFGVSPLTPGRATTQEPRVGVPWLLGSDGIYAIPLRTFCRSAKMNLEIMHDSFPHLVNVVSCTNTVHIQWLAWLGFQFTALHPKYGKGRQPSLQFERSRICAP
jgi:hypothetical protein